MTNPAAKGERFLAVAGETMSIRDMAMILRAKMGDAAKKVPTRELPNWVIRLVALTDAEKAALPAPAAPPAPVASGVEVAGVTRNYPPLETATPRLANKGARLSCSVAAACAATRVW